MSGQIGSSPRRDGSSRPFWRAERIAPILIIIATIFAYANSFTGPFIFDDVSSILDNPNIRRLWPLKQALSTPSERTVTGRPIVSLSLALNYAAGGFDVWGYHLFNLAVHILSALVLFGIVRRTLRRTHLSIGRTRSPDWLAGGIALVWAVHPLATESVTYIIQRTELLMGFFLLLTLYTFICGADSPRSYAWYAASIASCALGTSCKENMAVAPVLVLLYDRVFLSQSFRTALRRRWPVHAGIAATLLLQAALLASNPRRVATLPAATVSSTPSRSQLAPLATLYEQFFSYRNLTPWNYLLTQSGVIVHYLQLSIWPNPLSIDYSDWPVAGHLADVFPEAAFMLLLLGLTAWAFYRKPWLGFVGSCFFLILAPTSSIFPLPTEIAAERRMYLPLIPVIATALVAGQALLERLIGKTSVARLEAGLLGVLVAILVWTTAQRNEDYRTEMSIWRNVLEHRPNDAHAYNNLGAALARHGKLDDAMPLFSRAITLDPRYAEAYNNLGAGFYQQRRVDEAVARMSEALRLKPNYQEAHLNLALALHYLGRIDQAIVHYREALRLKPTDAEAHNHLGAALLGQGKSQDAITQFIEALHLNPNYAEARKNLSAALAYSH